MNNIVDLAAYIYKKSLSRGRVPLVSTLPPIVDVPYEDMLDKVARLNKQIDMLKGRLTQLVPTTQRHTECKEVTTAGLEDNQK